MKEKCSNHPNKNSLSFCHSCGKYFCEDCLNEGEEYYYCKEEKCQLLLKKEKLRLQIIKIKKDSPEDTEKAKNQEVDDLRAAFIKAIKATAEAYRAGNKEGLKEKLSMIVNRARLLRRKISAIRDTFELTDAEMKKISLKNPDLLSQSEFNSYLDDLRQRAFKLADNKFEKARIDLDKKSKEQLKATINQKDEKPTGDNKEKRIAMKTIKELNKALNEKQWYRLLKILWLISYPVFLVVGMKKVKAARSFTDASSYFFIFTLSFLGATLFLKRAVYYAAYYITTGNIFLKELNIKERLFLLFIFLWGILSVVILLLVLFH
ncbi:MAG: hypothetical protein WA240_14535 [Nitrospirota bacterium]